MRKATLLAAIVLTAAILAGCADSQRPVANCGWTMRAQAQVENQNAADSDEAYFARYERTFTQNERVYYRTAPGQQRDGSGAYAWQEANSPDQSENIQ